MKSRRLNTDSPQLRQRARCCESQSIITPFPANSLTTRDFSWFHAETWNNETTEFFLANRQELPKIINRYPPWQRKPLRPSPRMLGRWVLQSSELISTAELQGIYNKFNRLQLSLGSHTNNWQDMDTEISLLISGLLLMSECDSLLVITPNAASAASLARIMPEPKEIWAPNPEPQTPIAGEKFQVFSIEPNRWWESEAGMNNREVLRYLETRRLRQEQKNRHKKKPHKKRGFFRWFSRS